MAHFWRKKQRHNPIFRVAYPYFLNKALWLAVPCHVTSIDQLEYFASA